MMLRGGYLIHFNDKVKVSYQGKKMEGGYGTIQKCFIENDPAIPKHWAFAAKTQKGNSVMMTIFVKLRQNGDFETLP
jgi:hypothetical protein